MSKIACDRSYTLNERFKVDSVLGQIGIFAFLAIMSDLSFEHAATIKGSHAAKGWRFLGHSFKWSLRIFRFLTRPPHA